MDRCYETPLGFPKSTKKKRFTWNMSSPRLSHETWTWAALSWRLTTWAEVLQCFLSFSLHVFLAGNQSQDSLLLLLFLGWRKQVGGESRVSSQTQAEEKEPEQKKALLEIFSWSPRGRSIQRRQRSRKKCADNSVFMERISLTCDYRSAESIWWK